MEEYGISSSTYFRIIGTDLESLTNTNTYLYGKRKSSRTSDNVNLDSALIMWFTQERGKGIYVTGPQLKKKALILNKKLHGSITFKASDGWLNSFKRRFGIQMTGEILSTVTISPEEDFPQFLTEKIKTENLLLENVYNANESKIYWKSLVSHALDSGKKQEISEQDESKENITALFCSNASGTHQIPLLIIDESDYPCLNNFKDGKKGRLKNIGNLGVIYSHQNSGAIDRSIFMEWYKDEFIPRVLEFQKESGKLGKVILIIDSSPFHPILEELNAVNSGFEILFFPPLTGLTQPMELSVTAAIQSYKKHLLRRLLLNNTQEEAVNFLKKLDLRECLILLKSSWESLNSFSLQKAWKPILGITQNSLENNGINDFPHDLCNKTVQLLSGSKCSDQSKESIEKLSKWFLNENYTCLEPLSNGVANFDTNRICESIVDFTETEIPENNLKTSIASSKALDCLEDFKNWLKTCKKCLPVHLFYVKELETLVRHCLPENLEKRPSNVI